MSKVKLTLVKSFAKRSPAQRATLTALGFKKTYQVIEKKTSPSVDGMIAKVMHLLKVESI
ncbi:MAG: 50S ribosomal protein L30 [Bacteroidota bacterium]|nr:50S ribosomal protein L30 [Bacteroidota bacterium]